MTTKKLVKELVQDLEKELNYAMGKYPSFHSSHEGFAVILEEVDELWEEVRKKSSKRSKKYMKNECRQIAAMAIRFIVDLCQEGKNARNHSCL